MSTMIQTSNIAMNFGSVSSAGNIAKTFAKNIKDTKDAKSDVRAPAWYEKFVTEVVATSPVKVEAEEDPICPFAPMKRRSVTRENVTPVAWSLGDDKVEAWSLGDNKAEAMDEDESDFYLASVSELEC